MSRTILIADDGPFIREALCKVFEREGEFDVCGEAENGWEAVEKARESRSGLILIDLSMPVMNGSDALDVHLDNSQDWGKQGGLSNPPLRPTAGPQRGPAFPPPKADTAMKAKT